MRKLLFIFFQCYNILFLSAQTFKGKVTNEVTNTPLDMVSVSLLQADSLTVSFAMTDHNGHFSVTAPLGKKGKYLCFTYMGYAPKWVPVQNYNEGGEVRLQPKDIIIKEVKFVSKRLKQEGDTLTYSVSGFRMPQDRTIGDVLKKLPGIEVANDGQIKYQGKAINKFYIEGMNLLEGKYNLATNNLSAKAVKDVQVLENHQAITALRGNSFSENAALNLVLEDKAKARILGTVDAGAGVEDQSGDLLWDNRLLGMLFNARVQNLSMYKNNNTGVDVGQELKVLTIENINQLKVMSQEHEILSPISVGSPDLNQQRYYFNDAHLFSINNLWRIKKNNDLRIQASYLHNREKQNGSSVNTYYLPDRTLIIDESVHAIHAKDEIEGELTYNINNKKLFLKNALKLQVRFGDNEGWMQTNSKAMNQSTDLDRQVLTNDFQLIRNFGKNVFRFFSMNMYSNIPQHLSVAPSPYADWLNGGKEYNFMQQDLRLRSFASHTYTSFQHKLFGMYIEYRTGLKVKDQSLHSILNTSGSDFPETSRDSFLNRSHFTEFDLYVTPSLSYQNYSFKGKVEVATTIANLYQHNNTVNKYRGNENHLLFEPNVFLEYVITALWKINGSFNYRHSYSDIYNIYPGYVFTSYRNVSANGSDLTLHKSMNINGSINFKNPVKGFFFDLSGYYTHEHRNMLTSSRFNGILQQTVNVKQNVESERFGVNATYSKSFSFWKTLLRLNTSYNGSEDTRLWSEILTRFRSDNINSSASLFMQPCHFINWEASSDYLYSTMKTVKPEKKGYSPVRSFHHKLALNVIPSDKWQFKWLSEYYHITDKGLKKSLFSDLSLSYLFKESELQFSAMNIFNNDEYQRRNIGSLSQSVNLNKLRPRQFVIKYLFNF